MSAGVIRSVRRRPAGKKSFNPSANRPQPTARIGITEASVSGSVLAMEFDQAVALKGTPQITTDVEGAEPVSAALISPTRVEITYSASVAAATQIEVPYEEPAIRNSSGGFLTPSTFPI